MNQDTLKLRNNDQIPRGLPKAVSNPRSITAVGFRNPAQLQFESQRSWTSSGEDLFLRYLEYFSFRV